jgi:multidrug transporter EmrE-like cation transporter
MLMMAAAALGLAYWLHGSLAAPAKWSAVPQRIWQVFIPLLGAGLAYWLLAAALGVDSAQSILKLFRRKTQKEP